MKNAFARVMACFMLLVLSACTTPPAAVKQSCCVNCSEAGCCCDDYASSDCDACESCSPGIVAGHTDKNLAVITAAGMSCPLCAANIDRQLKRIEGFETMRMNLDTGELFVEFDAASRPSTKRLAQAIRDAGFTVDSVQWRDSAANGGKR
ncbi:MAG: cation transporter [Planctomycetota bacterium]